MKDHPLLKANYFNEDLLFSYLEQFSYPRLAGSEGDKKAINEVAEVFQGLGFKKNEVKIEEFTFSDFYSTILIKLIMMLSLMDMLLIQIFIFFAPFYNFFVIAGSAIPIYFLLKGLNHPEDTGFVAKYWGNMIETKNVFVKIPAKDKSQEKVGNIVFSGHIDTKSQAYATAWRIVVYRVWLFSGFFTAFFLGLDLIFNQNWLKIAVSISIAVIMANNIILMLLTTSNKSPGAIDNASGMSCAFEIARYFKANPLDNYNVWVCQFGAEELGTMGSRNFVNNYEKEFEKGKVFQFNFDMIGYKGVKYGVQMMESYGIPKRNISVILTKCLKQAAKELDLEIEGFYLSTGAHLDSVPFHQRNWDAIDIVTREGAIVAHTKRDIPDNIDKEILRNACLITVQAAIMLDNDYHTQSQNKSGGAIE
jgi:hypothetical protein